MNTTCSLSYRMTNLLTGLPTGLYSKNLNYKDNITTFNVVTKINLVGMFYYEFPTTCHKPESNL